MVDPYTLLKLIETCPGDNLDAGEDANNHRTGADYEVLSDQVNRLYRRYDVTDEGLPGFPRCSIETDHGRALPNHSELAMNVIDQRLKGIDSALCVF